MAESRLDVVINPSRAQSGARAVKSSIDSLKGSWIDFTAKAFVAEQSISRVWKAASAGADFEEGLERLNVQMGRFHSTAQLMINDLKNVSNGQLSNADAVQVASRAMMQGLDPDQIRVFTQAADLLGDVMGTDLKGSFDTILQGLTTGRTQVLANIGVYVDLEKESRELAVATNRTTEQITKQEKAAIGARAVMQQLGGTLDKFASDAVSDADKMKAIEVRFDDMTLAVGRFSKSMVMATVDFFKWMEATRHDTSLNPFAAANQAVRQSTPGHMENPITQEIMGRAIVADTQGNLARKAAQPKPKPFELDPKLRMIQVQAAADRMREEIEATRDSTILGLQHQTRLQGFDQQMGWQGPGRNSSALDFLKSQHDTKQRELALAGEAQNKLLQLETETYQKRVKLGFDTTREKITAEEEFKKKVQEINGEVAKIIQEFGNASRESVAEQQVLELKSAEDTYSWIQGELLETYQFGDDLRHKDQDNAIAYYANLAKFQEAYGTTREQQMTTEYDLVRANLAKQLDTTFDVAAKILNAWRNNDHTRAEELLGHTKLTAHQVTAIWMGTMANQRAVSKQFSDDMLSGFGDGLHRYVNDQSMFGLGADQARSVAQAMQGAFKQHFFDGLRGEVTSLKDVIGGLVDFTQNILADVSSKLVTRMVLGGIDGLMSGGGGGFGSLFGGGRPTGVPWMARGGVTNGPSIAGEAGPEAVVPLPDGRSIPVEWKGGPYGAPDRMVSTHAPAPQINAPVEININNHATDTDIQAESRMRPDGTKQIDIVVTNIVRNGFRDGAFDHVMKQNFNANRKPGRR
jgi:hypothetical protein